MRRFMKRLHRGEKGFTLIELLIVIAILGIIAAIVIPNAAGFMTSGRLNAANTEVANVKTAAVGYMAEYGDWPDTSDDLGDYLEGGTTNLKAKYDFTNFSITSTSPTNWDGDTNITWDTTAQQWKRT